MSPCGGPRNGHFRFTRESARILSRFFPAHPHPRAVSTGTMMALVSALCVLASVRVPRAAIRMSDVSTPAEATPPPSSSADNVAGVAVPSPTTPSPAEGAREALFALGAYTNRGESALESEKAEARSLAVAIEATAGEVDNAACFGTWELCFADTQPFRASPFFMAARAVCTTPEDVARFNWFCEQHRAALAISTVERVRQILGPGRLVNEFEVKAGSVPFSDRVGFPYAGGLPVTITGCIRSSADVTFTGPGEWELYMDTVEIKGSNIPGLRALLDSQLRLDSRRLGDALEANVPGYSNPRPLMRTTYADSILRISRDVDDHVFVYRRLSDSRDPTDFGNVAADFGLGTWLARLPNLGQRP